MRIGYADPPYPGQSKNHFDGDGTATGWSLLGDGTEAWTMGDPPRVKHGAKTLDELMLATKALMP